MTLNEDLNRIRDIRGLPRLDGTQYVNPGENIPPPPPLEDFPAEDTHVEFEPDREPDDEERFYAVEPPKQDAVIDLKLPDLFIAGDDGKDAVAQFQGRQTILRGKDLASIKKIVLESMARDIRIQLETVTAQLPKRKRNRGKDLEGSTPHVRRRGRPRKQEAQTS